MNSIMAGLLVAACIFAGGLTGLYLDRIVPKRHLTRETQDVIKFGIAMLSVLASLVLGLLIATAKTSYDSTDRAIRSYAAELALLNEVLRDYGDDASAAHNLLRSYTERLLEDGWPKGGRRPAILEDEETRLLLEHVREAIRALNPMHDGQKSLQIQAIDVQFQSPASALATDRAAGTERATRGAGDPGVVGHGHFRQLRHYSQVGNIGDTRRLEE
jgi:hypothetical protein